jgi:hypothetical protein
VSTPLEISIALWYYAHEGDYVTDKTAPVVEEALARFVDAGLLKRNEPNADLPQKYFGTDGLRVYVDMLCQMPWPVQQWVLPNGLKGAGSALGASLYGLGQMANNEAQRQQRTPANGRLP